MSRNMNKRYYYPMGDYNWRYKKWYAFMCWWKGHLFVPHFTGKKVQFGRNAPVGEEVDFYYCKRCRMKDPERNEFSPDPNKNFRKSCYIS